MAYSARIKFGAPIFETEVFREQIYCIEKNTYDIVGTFWHPPQLFSAQELCPPCYAPAWSGRLIDHTIKTFLNTRDCACQNGNLQRQMPVCRSMP